MWLALLHTAHSTAATQYPQSPQHVADFPNPYKLVNIYIYTLQPHSSIDCERGFSAPNRIKSKSRNRLSVARLELLMRLSLLHKQ